MLSKTQTPANELRPGVKRQVAFWSSNGHGQSSFENSKRKLIKGGSVRCSPPLCQNLIFSTRSPAEIFELLLLDSSWVTCVPPARSSSNVNVYSQILLGSMETYGDCLLLPETTDKGPSQTPPNDERPISPSKAGPRCRIKSKGWVMTPRGRLPKE